VIAAASPWGDYNDYTWTALRAHKKRLRGTAIFNRAMERSALEAMSRDGFVGIRLPFIGLSELPDITGFDTRALFRRLADLDWHVHPHVEGEDLPKILPTLEASGVKIVVDHLGRPDPKGGINSAGFRRLLQSIDKGRTWVKISGGYRLGPQAQDYARELVRVAGPDRLVWASDCPFVGREGAFPYHATIDWLVDAVPDADARAKIFGETARALYFGGE
jgi:predicted TIM-barrel fold metal-dependent hydrolase